MPEKPGREELERRNRELLEKVKRLKSAAEAGKISGREFRPLFERRPLGYQTLDENGCFLEVSPAWLNTFGYDREEVVGKSLDLFLPPDWKKRIAGLLHGSRRVGEIFDAEYGMVRKNGSRTMALFDCEIWPDPASGPARTHCVLRRLTEFTEPEEKMMLVNQELENRIRSLTEELDLTIKSLRRAEDQLMEREKMFSLGGLVAGISHEISTPLGIGVTGVSFIVDQCRKMQNDYNTGQLTRSSLEDHLETTLEMATSLLSNLKNAAELIHSFKSVAVDQSTGYIKTFSVKECLEEVLLSLKPQYKGTGHTIVLSAPEEIMIRSFPGSITQVVTNLVMNALTHGFKGSEAGQITIRLLKTEAGIRLEFSDDGRGMDEAESEKIFDRFYTTRRGRGGTGLGLHIVHNIVTHELKGTISCTSAPGKGTHFTIEIPDLADKCP